jgi:hypothetical protein
MTKLLVGLGETSSSGITDTIEIIDLDSESKTCRNLPNSPLALKGSFGGLGFSDKPMICGGQDKSISKQCFSFEEKEWIHLASLNTKRHFAAISPSPYPSKFQKVFVTGGLNGDSKLKTTEVLTEQGWKTLAQSLPVTVYGHCSVLVNSTTVMIIGGRQNDSTSPNTYFFNTETEVWTEGPQLKNRRSGHSCGRIRKNRQSQEFSIVVAGGYYKLSLLSSVEILDLGSKEWRKGPDLPFGIYEGEMVEDQSGGVVLVGGESDADPFLDTLIQLPHGGADAEWIRMKQKLKLKRRNHVAFLVPDNIVDCS